MSTDALIEQGRGSGAQSVSRRRLWIFVWSAAGVYLLGALFGQRPHVVLAAAMLGLAFREYLLGRQSLAKVWLQVEVPALVPAGQPATMAVDVKSPSTIHALEVTLDVALPDGADMPGVLFESLAADRPAQRTVVLGGLPRGRYPIAGVVVESEGEMGLIRRRHERLRDDCIDAYPLALAPARTVGPPLEPLEVTTGIIPGPVGGGGGGGASGSTFLRPLGSGDDLRRIHWRATARLGEIVVLSTRLGPAARVLILVDTAPDPRFETVLRVASWALEHRWDGRPVTLALASDPVEEIALSCADPLAAGRHRLAGARPGSTTDLAAFLARVPRHLPECEIAVVSATLPRLPSLEGFPMGIVLAGDREARG